MSKMIDGNKLIIVLSDWWYSSFGLEETEESKAVHKVLDAVERYVDHVKSADEWIPCSERLPDDDGDYLVWLEDESDHYAVVYFDTGADAFGWWVDHYDPITLGFIESDFCEAKNITAWQPLPTPYKGGDTE